MSLIRTFSLIALFANLPGRQAGLHPAQHSLRSGLRQPTPAHISLNYINFSA